MKNIMVCVTQQKSCDRLIRYGQQLVEPGKSEFYIIHVAPKNDKFLNGQKDGEALDYLFEKAQEIGANLTVVRSNNVLETLVGLVEKNEINYVVLGTTGNIKNREDLLGEFKSRVEGQAELVMVPPTDDDEEF